VGEEQKEIEVFSALLGREMGVRKRGFVTRD